MCIPKERTPIVKLKVPVKYVFQDIPMFLKNIAFVQKLYHKIRSKF
jgi:hypothetical protein